MLDHIDIAGRTRPWPSRKRGIQPWHPAHNAEGHPTHYTDPSFFALSMHMARGIGVSSEPTGSIRPSAVAIALAYEECSALQPSIAATPNVLAGKPCVAGTRIPVSLVLRYLATGDDPVDDFGITPKDVEDCLEFAALLCDYSSNMDD